MVIEEKIKNKYPNWDFKILYYNNITKEITIKCLKCNKENTYKKYYNLLYKKYPCACVSCASQCKTFQYKKELESFFKNNNDFTFIEWTKLKQDKDRPAVMLKCNTCNQFFIKKINLFYKNRKCPYCRPNGIPNTQSVKEKLKKKGYTLLSDYKNQDTEITLKHNYCGFIWKMKPVNFCKSLNDFSCPSCNNKISRGERKIMNYLINNKIDFEREYKFSWQKNKLFRYDFYIPKYNLIIEYNGKQHYEETNFFSFSLEKTQLHDRIKKAEAEKHGYNFLVISYLSFNNIEKILSSWFNDYERRQ